MLNSYQISGVIDNATQTSVILCSIQLPRKGTIKRIDTNLVCHVKNTVAQDVAWCAGQITTRQSNQDGIISQPSGIIAILGASDMQSQPQSFDLATPVNPNDVLNVYFSASNIGGFEFWFTGLIWVLEGTK